MLQYFGKHQETYNIAKNLNKNFKAIKFGWENFGLNLKLMKTTCSCKMQLKMKQN